ncbi:hypothetical protein [Clostridium intestinale]|uniref:Putative lipoprotein n=1 Tax=Clostridium intestinale URNW TaxID=1294142 RepID=U2NMM9_9CLOT|nr:hypothetical protein [Clostridium intestinale]ERK30101.1 putative lipoprotein [Clostridium intestinale URNW]
MKRVLSVFMLAFSLLIFTSCKAKNPVEVKEKYIQKAELTKLEDDIVKLVGDYENQIIYDFNLDEKVQSIQISIYELKDNKWDSNIGRLSQEFTDIKGRLSLNFNNFFYGYRIAFQSENSNASTKFSTEKPAEPSTMGQLSSFLDSKSEITYEKEIPLVVQGVTSGNTMTAHTVDYFYTPEKYKELGYDRVYAVTVLFSEKQVSELNVIKE